MARRPRRNPTASTGRTDPDIDLAVDADRRETRRGQLPVLGAVAAGGVLGALGRAGLQAAFPYAPEGFPWSTFAVNISGCLLIGVLVTLVDQVWTRHWLLRPLVGTGVLGGFTTFSGYVVDIQQAVVAGAVTTALAYLAATLLGALLAVWVGAAATGALLRRTHPTGSRAPDDRPAPHLREPR